MDGSGQATVNAWLNATSATFLIAGLACIRAKKVAAHAVLMVGALIASGLFLTSYVLYHLRVGRVHFGGTGWIRPIYFTILMTHTLLAVAIVPLVLRTVFLAVRNRLTEHMAIARWTFPLWLYVSVSGIVVYYLLYRSRWAV